MEVSDDPAAPPSGLAAGIKPQGDDERLWRALKDQGSTTARERLFSLHLPFARKIANRHYYRGHSGDIEFSDLNQWAAQGLLEAIDQFDLDRGVPFQGYAARRIAGCILDGLAKINDVRGQISFRNRIRRERVRSLTADEPPAADRDDALGQLISVAVGLAIGFMLEGTSLYVDGEPRDLGATAYESLNWKDTVRRVHDEIDHLPEREQAIIRHHYINGLTFERISQLLHLSKGRISQLHRAALATLRSRIGRNDDFKLER